MTEATAQRALAASTFALVLALACALLFVPPYLERYLGEPVHRVSNGLVLAGALALHWYFLGVAVRRQQRPLAGWLALAVLLFPLGGAAALMLLSASSEESPSPAPSR